jgi:hypothetical protein
MWLSSAAQRCHHAGTVAAAAVIVFPQLGVADAVPALQAPALSHQAQQRFWGCAQAGDEPRVGIRHDTSGVGVVSRPPPEPR